MNHSFEKIYRTTQGESLRMEWAEDTEAGRKVNTAWIVHQMQAFMQKDGQEVAVGHLKVSYIPADRVTNEYPSILQFMEKVKGRWGIAHENPIRRLMYISQQCEPWSSWLSEEKVRALSVAERSERTARYMEQLEERYGKEFQEHIAFHVDKPLVDAIHVQKEFRRRRIAMALYEATARKLAEKNMVLFASGTQSDAAKAAWEAITKDPVLAPHLRTVPSPMKDEPDRRYLTFGPEIIQQVVPETRRRKRKGR